MTIWDICRSLAGKLGLSPARTGLAMERLDYLEQRIVIGSILSDLSLTELSEIVGQPRARVLALLSSSLVCLRAAAAVRQPSPVKMEDVVPTSVPSI